MSSLEMRWILAVVALAGCTPTLQDGQFTCTTDSDCPTGFTCRASDMRCHRSGEDGGASQDGGAPDDADVADAPTGCGASCIQLMVLNADPFLTGTISYDDRDGETGHVAIPPYGTTSAVVDLPNVPVGETLRVNVPPTITIFHDLPIPTESRYLLVLGPASIGASVRLLESNPEGLHTNGYAYVQLVDMVADETDGLIARGAGRNPDAQMLPNPFDHEGDSAVLPFLPGSTGALRLELAGETPELIAALLGDRIPGTEGTYYVVVAGRLSAHLDSMEGLRFIPGLPGATALRSSRLVRFVNSLTTSATVCDGATPLATVPAGALRGPFVPPGSGPWALSVHRSTDCATGVSHDVSVGTNVGRTLVSIAGDDSLAAGWQAVAIPEPLPTAGVETIVIHNGLSTAADIAMVTNIPSLGTASTTVITAPDSITATTMEGVRTFEWAPRTRQSWVVIGRSGARFTAYEMDSPFDEAWTLTEVTGVE
ncbi:dickkopf-related protein [Sandaracinus amylolyticus]|uniref:dickkopf-related protein n=1 Tax=Sandaracinus amylolyticus TaxID=927083 RepID=UPI001F243369|nr:dickkopf-related protein [Sandaracinus amylolyticus]UJR81394.1 Hypothetical protein I5071_34510 [Sandaracinus amylolyticus]